MIDRIASDCAFKPTWTAGAARSLAAEAVREGFGTVVAAGGDGTINEVVNGVADVPCGLETVRLGVIPLGTANVFAREMRIPLKPEASWGVIQGGVERSVDLPRVEFMGPTGPVSRCFVQMTGAGYDARAVELVSWRLKKLAGFIAYCWAAFCAWRERGVDFEVEVGDEKLECRGAIVSNGRYYAGPIPVFPGAVLDDGYLDLVVVPRLRLGMVWGCSWGLIRNKIETVRGLRYFRAQRVVLRGRSRVALHVDGEAAGELPATVSMNPTKLRTLVPAA